MMKKGFLYYLMATLLMATLLMSYMIGSTAVQVMDLTGWLFFFLSCVTHAATLMLAVWLVAFLPWALLRQDRLAATLLTTLTGVLGMLLFVNMQVYKIYKFHINGMVLSLLTGEGAGDIFQFDTKLLLQEGALLLLIAAACAALWWAAGRLCRHLSRRCVKAAIGLLAASALVANGIHTYGAFVQKTSVLQSAKLIPYYFPLTATRFMMSLGIDPAVPTIDGDMRSKGVLQYPVNELVRTAPADTLRQPVNIVLLLIDSWNRRSLTPETMPNTYRFATENEWFANHVSSSNGTRFSVFSIFTGLPSYYWSAFEASHTSPALVDELLRQGYDFRAYPSATLQSPPFNRLLFQRVPNLRTKTEGQTVLERDQRIARDFCADLPQLKDSGRPFFSFVFFDLPHSNELPKDSLNRFRPTWEYANYAALSNEADPTPFWNLYRHCCYQTDRLVGQILQQLQALGLMDNTVVMITGDHGQEFNENRKNYWGHAGNFSVWQIGVPFIVHRPGMPPRKYQHRTTHYDISATLMHDYLGIQNPTADYSDGHLLTDPQPRLWHFVGDDLLNAFIVEGDTILLKQGGGWMEVTDARLNPVSGYRVNGRQMNQAFIKLNRFYR